MIAAVSDLSAQAHAAVLLKVTAKTVREARRAWKRIKPDNPDSIRTAFRSCVLAARFAHRAAVVWAHDASQHKRLTAEGHRLTAAAAELKKRLARALEQTAHP